AGLRQRQQILGLAELLGGEILEGELAAGHFLQLLHPRLGLALWDVVAVRERIRDPQRGLRACDAAPQRRCDQCGCRSCQAQEFVSGHELSSPFGFVAKALSSAAWSMAATARWTETR